MQGPPGTASGDGPASPLRTATKHRVRACSVNATDREYRRLGDL